MGLILIIIVVVLLLGGGGGYYGYSRYGGPGLGGALSLVLLVLLVLWFFGGLHATAATLPCCRAIPPNWNEQRLNSSKWAPALFRSQPIWRTPKP